MMKNWMSRKLIVVFALALALVLGGMFWPEMAMVARADNGVSYREASWNESTNTVSYTIKTADNVAQVVSASDTSWTDGWYVVNTDATITNRITVEGNVNLILADGKTLTASQGITVINNNSLTIYGQEAGTGKLIANPPDNVSDIAAIGKNGFSTVSGNITIHGGHILANEKNSHGYSGIGGIGGSSTGCTITIYGGNISAYANGGGGINAGPSGTVNIYGGTVAAIDDGSGAGIGSAPNQGCGTIMITGGSITARSKANGSGIGTGNDGEGGKISITGGMISASSRSGAAIGSGYGSTSSYVDEIIISGAAVTAEEYMVNGDYYDIGVIGNDKGKGQVTVQIKGNTSLSGSVKNMEVAANTTLTVPENGVLNVTGTLTNNGTVTNNGTLTNNGTMTIASGATLINHGTMANNGTLTNNGTANNTGSYSGSEPTGNGSNTGFLSRLTVTAPDVSVPYDGNPHGITVTDVKDSVTEEAVSGYSVGYAESETATTWGEQTSLQIIDVSESPKTIYYKVSASDYNDDIGSATVTIQPKALTAEGVYFAFNPTTFIYNGSAQAPTTTVTDNKATIVPNDYTLKYQRIKDAGGNAVTESATASAPTNTGTYKVIVTGGNNYSGTVEQEFTISKAAPALNGTLTATATYGDTLSAVSLNSLPYPTGAGNDGNLSGSWAWVETATTSVGDSGTRNHQAIFTPVSGNYEPIRKDISITVGRANLTIVSPSVTAKYGETMADVKSRLESQCCPTGINNQPVNGSWSWTSVQDTDPVGNVGTHTYQARFTPSSSDATNYNSLSVDVSVTVDKADPVAKAPTGVTAIYGQTLANVALTNPDGNTAGTWAWANTSTDVGSLGDHTFPANFMPTDTANYNSVSNVDVTVTVEKATVTVSGIKVTTKEYDGTTAATLDFTDAVLTGKVDGDDLSVTATGTFVNETVGDNKDVSITGLTLGGNAVGNYVLASSDQQTSAKGNITTRAITITPKAQTVEFGTGFSSDPQLVDITKGSLLSGHSISAVTITPASASAGTDISLTPGAATIRDTSGKDVTDDLYSITYADAHVGTITQVTVYISGNVTASNKTYDGSAAATVTGTETAVLKRADNDTVVSGLTVSDISADFSDKSVGTGKTVSITEAKLSDAVNYTVNKEKTNSVLGLTANITPRTVTITGVTVKNRTYEKDRLDVEIDYPGSISGAVDGDDVRIIQGSANLATANAGTDKAVIMTEMKLRGADAGNYTLSEQPSGVTVTIYKAAKKSLSTGYTAGCNQTSFSQSLSGDLPDDMGTLSFRVDEVTKQGSVSVADCTVSNDLLTVAFSNGAVGDTINVKLTVTSTNYEDSELTVTVSLIEDAGISIAGVPDEVTYADPDFTLTGSVTTPGTGDSAWMWKSSDKTVLKVTQDTTNANKAMVSVVKVGSAAITAEYKSGTTKSMKTVTITVKPITATVFADDVTAAYGDTGKKIEASVDSGGTLSYAVKSGDAVTVDSSTGALTVVKAGTAVITVTADATEYYAQAAKDVTVTVNKAASTPAVLAANNRKYDGTEKPLVTVDESTLEGGEMRYALGENDTTAPTDGWKKEIPTGTNAKTYYVWYMIEGDANHEDSDVKKPIQVTIDKKEATIAADDKSKAYGETDPALTATVTGEVNGEKLEYTLARETGDTVGTYAIQVTLKDGSAVNANYSITATDGVFTISEAGKDDLKAALEEAKKYYEENQDPELKKAIDEAEKTAEDPNVQKDRIAEETEKLKEALEQAKKDAQDKEAAEKVKALIDALPDPEKVTTSDKDTIEAARKAYDALTDDQKKLFDETSLKHLIDDEAALKAAQEAEEKAKADKEAEEKAKADKEAADKKAADAVKALIDALAKLEDVKTSDKDAIEAARKAYDALTDDQKKLIDETTLKHLTDDEAALKAAQEAEEKARADQEAAEKVKALIDALSDPEKVTTADKDAIEAARKAYDELTDDQKKLIDEDTLKHLTDDEEALKAAEEEEAKKIPMDGNGWVQKDGSWYYVADGYALIGSNEIDGTLYVFNEEGKMVTGWAEIDGKWFCARENGTAYHSEWLKDGDYWYYFRDNGEMLRGWVKDGDAWFFLMDPAVNLIGWTEDNGRFALSTPDGAMATGWMLDGDTWYYYNADGSMYTGWLKDGAYWYYLTAEGPMATGWLKDGGHWYYLNTPSGAMLTGWVLDGGTWYYMDDSGAMQTGWIKYGGEWYFLDETGAMQTGWFKGGSKWYLLKDNGAMATGWELKNGKWYFLDEVTGAMKQEEWFEDKKAEQKLPQNEKRELWYWFDENGVMATGWTEIAPDQWEMFADNGEWLYTWNGK